MLIDGNNSITEARKQLALDQPEAYKIMINHLESNPAIGIRGTAIQMRLDTRVWEYKLSWSYRVLYTVDINKQQVNIDYVGHHLNKRCTDNLIKKMAKKLS